MCQWNIAFFLFKMTLCLFLIIFNGFSQIWGYKVNWSKSALLPLKLQQDSWPQYPILIQNFKYVGVSILPSISKNCPKLPVASLVFSNAPQLHMVESCFSDVLVASGRPYSQTLTRKIGLNFNQSNLYLASCWKALQHSDQPYLHSPIFNNNNLQLGNQPI